MPPPQHTDYLSCFVNKLEIHKNSEITTKVESFNFWENINKVA